MAVRGPVATAHHSNLFAERAGAASRESAKKRERAEMNKLVKLFAKAEDGVTALEYGLIAGLIAVVIAASAQGLGTELKAVFTYVTTQLTAAVPAGT